MTLEEIKQKVYAMIEEYSEDADDLTEDADLASKMNGVINQIQNELARMKKIDAYTSYEATEGDVIDFTDIDSNLYQVNLIKGLESEIIGNRVLFNETGTADIYYYKYPTQIDADTEDSYVFELDRDALEIMSYGVAADLLKSDVSSQYGQVYANRYSELKNELDPRKAMPSMRFTGGIDL